MTVVKVQRAVEDILDKLGMPSLELYNQPAIAQSQHIPLETRGNSEEPVQLGTKETDTQRNVSPDPINSLMEATNLNGLRSQLRTAKLRRKGGMRRMESDLISEQIVSYEEAGAMLAQFQRTQSPHLFSATIPPGATLDSIRASSTVLFEAIMLVSALQIPGKEKVHEVCHGRFMALASAIMFDRFHALDDIRGLCIAAMWQPDLSWKLSGLGMRMATELNLHHALYQAFSAPVRDDGNRPTPTQQECLEKARLWYLLYLLDHQSGVAYGRPPMKSALRPIRDFDLLLKSDMCTPSDRVLLAQVTGFGILSRAFDHFGLEPNRTMDGTDDSVLNHLRYTEELRAWMERWTMDGESDLARSVMLQYHFSSLVLHSLVLRGRPLDRLAGLPACLRPLALKAVDAAQSILQHFLHESTYRDEFVGMPFYLHSMIAFAVVFLAKLSHRWHAIAITIDPQTVSWPLVESIIRLLRTCKAGKNHMVYRMADGFERMLQRLRAVHSFPINELGRLLSVLRDAQAGAPAQPDRFGPDVDSIEAEGHSSEVFSRVDQFNADLLPGPLEYDGWDFGDEQPYDLLGLGGQGLFADMDPFTLS